MSKTNFKELREMSILDVSGMEAFVRQFNLKRLVVGRGHDCGGLVCDLYLRSVMYADYNDDGWGGEPNVTFMSQDKADKLEKMLNDVNFAQVMFDNGWAFMDDVKKICFQSQVEHLVETLAHLKEVDRIQKKCKGRFVYGTDFRIEETYWPGVKDLKELSVRQLQKTYNSLSAKLPSGHRFFNTDEQLKGLGIKI